MRAYEMVIVLLNLLFLCRSGLKPGWGGRFFIVTISIVSSITIILHVLQEGARFQMFPAYVCTAVILLHAVRSLLRRSAGKSAGPVKAGRWRTAGRLTILLLCAILIALPPFALPVFSFEKPTGPFAVGAADYHFRDPQRRESYESKPAEKRGLNVRIWYPAGDVSGHARAPYVEALPVLADEFSKRYGIPKFMFRYLSYVETQAWQEAPVSRERSSYPVILFSHGFPGGRYTNTFQTVELASHGFIVVSVEHTLSSFTTVFPNGQYIGMSGNQPSPADVSAWDRMIQEVWLKDSQFVLDQLADLNRKDPKGLLTGAVNLNLVGTMGHSFGGANASLLLLKDRRVKAAVNLDGTFFGGDLSQGLPGPFLLLSSDPVKQSGKPAVAEPTEKQLAAAGLTREQYNRLLVEIPRRKQDVLRNGGQEVIIPKAAHLSFSDFYLWLPALVWTNGHTEDPRKTHRTINQVTLDFFKKHLAQE